MFFRFYLHFGSGRVIDIKSFRVVGSPVTTNSNEVDKLN